MRALLLTKVAICATLVGCLPTTALACRGLTRWPTDENSQNISSEDAVVKAILLNSYESKDRSGSIMGSDDSFIYKIEIKSILKNSINKELNLNDIIYIENPGGICEFYRPWNYSDTTKMKNDLEKLIIIRKRNGFWNVIGGEAPRRQ
jgi:hypothetical protein